MTKPTQNERIIARALHGLALRDGRESLSWVCLERESQEGWFEDARWLVKRENLLAVNAKTVPLTMREPEPGQYHEWPDFRAYLRAMARGKP